MHAYTKLAKTDLCE